MLAMTRTVALCTTLSAIPAVCGCGSTPQISSRWRSETVQVDGKSGEWSSVPSYAGKEKFTIAVQHDQENLYLCLTTQDRATQMQLLGAGLILWFDPDGGKQKVFGINFPLGGPRGGPPPKSGTPAREPGSGGERDAMSPMPELSESSSMDILGADGADRHRLSTMENSGIVAKIGRSDQRTLVYELQVPLKKSEVRRFAVQARDGMALGIGVTTPEVDQDRMREGPGGPSERMGGGPPDGMDGSGGAPPGGMGGSGGAPPGGMGRGRGGWGPGAGMPGRTDPLDFWMTVTLLQAQK